MEGQASLRQGEGERLGLNHTHTQTSLINVEASTQWAALPFHDAHVIVSRFARFTAGRMRALRISLSQLACCQRSRC